MYIEVKLLFSSILDDSHSAPMNVEVDLPLESGFVSDASLLLAEKILAKVGHTGKFNRIGIDLTV